MPIDEQIKSPSFQKKLQAKNKRVDKTNYFKTTDPFQNFELKKGSMKQNYVRCEPGNHLIRLMHIFCEGSVKSPP